MYWWRCNFGITANTTVTVKAEDKKISATTEALGNTTQCPAPKTKSHRQLITYGYSQI